MAAAGLVVVALAGGLPSGTGRGSLAVRAAVGLAAGVVLVAVVRRSFRSLAGTPPPPPEPAWVDEADVVYECGVCGTRVRLEVASTGKAPRHCGEEMEAKLSPRGRPP